MANTTWIVKIQNNTNLDISWRDGEDHSKAGFLPKNSVQDLEGSGLCFPWVDYTKDELSKAIDFRDQSSHLLFVMFQSYNKDTIQWLKPIPGQYANNAIDVAGPAGAGGQKTIIILQNPKNPKEIYPVLQDA